MRVQLAGPNGTLLTPEQYNDLFSTHGMTMIFLYASPILSGFSNYLWPLLLGSRDMAFPRLNALSYWIYLASGLFLYAGFLTGNGPNDGWFNYVPYAERTYNPGLNQDFYALGMVFLGISTTVGAANFIVTAMRTRAPGMSLSRLPIMIWGTLTASVANLLVIPAVSLAFFLLWMDRQYGTHFFDNTEGGQPLLWQHLFWIFGHPWVYAIVLPAMGMVSDGLPVFCRRPLVGYAPVAISTVATMVLGFGVWVHHMFATGLPAVSMSFFSGISIVIVVPSAIAVFAWLATIWLGRPVITTAFLFFSSMILLFVIGGVSELHDREHTGRLAAHRYLFRRRAPALRAHRHQRLSRDRSGVLLVSEDDGAVSWTSVSGAGTSWTMFIGFNLAFLPMRIPGLLRHAPARLHPQPGHGLGHAQPRHDDQVVRARAGRAAVHHQHARRSRAPGVPAGANPWDAPTLEWAASSPPPAYNFAVIPTVASRTPRCRSRGSARARRSIVAVDQGCCCDTGKETVGTLSTERASGHGARDAERQFGTLPAGRRHGSSVHRLVTETGRHRGHRRRHHGVGAAVLALAETGTA